MLLLERIISTISPDNCLICEDEGRPLCSACIEGEFIHTSSSCYRCGSPTRDFSTCEKCQKTSPLSHVWIAVSYEGYARELIHDLKFNAHRSTSGPIAGMCSAVLPVLHGFTATGLPTNSMHIRQRSFDHTKLIAKRIALTQKLPYYPLLRRVKNVKQTGSSRAERLQHMKNAFEPRSTYAIKGSKILLVDDVMTTGASIEEAARALKKAGAKEVCGIVFAR